MLNWFVRQSRPSKDLGEDLEEAKDALRILRYTFYIASKEGELLETHSSLRRAQHWAKQSADFLSEAGLQGPHRRVYQLMAGVGYILRGEF